MKELTEYIKEPNTGRPKRGAFSRFAEHLNVSPMTVSRWYSGEWIPSEETRTKILAMIAKNFPISSNHKGRSGRKKQPK